VPREKFLDFGLFNFYDPQGSRWKVFVSYGFLSFFFYESSECLENHN